MSHENAALVINQFQEIFAGTGREPKVWDPSRIAIIFDHRVPAESPKTATNQKKIREFVAANGITKFHDIRGDVGGICHQILPEYGYVRPGYVVVGTDSHTTTHGALGAFSFGVGATEMASVWSLGFAVNIEVPATIKVVVNGEFPPFVGAKDLILHIIGTLTAQGANYKVLEFHGETIRRMSTSGRIAVCNMSVEAGATSGIVPGDEETVRYLREESGVTEAIPCVAPDADARYVRTVEVDVSALEPQIACPHMVDNVKPVSAVAGTRVQQIVIGSCTNGRLDDLAVAAGHPARQEGRDRHPDAGLPGLGADLLAGAGQGLHPGLHEGRRGGDELRLRALSRRARRCARRQRDRAQHDESQLQGPHGQSEVRGLPLQPGRRRRLGHHRRHHRSQNRLTPRDRSPSWPKSSSSSATTSARTTSIPGATWPRCCRRRRRSSPFPTAPSSTPG